MFRPFWVGFPYGLATFWDILGWGRYKLPMDLMQPLQAAPLAPSNMDATTLSWRHQCCAKYGSFDHESLVKMEVKSATIECLYESDF